MPSFPLTSRREFLQRASGGFGAIALAGLWNELQAAPADPTNCAFGDADLASLYVTSTDGSLYRARNTGRRGIARR